jgi:hypothetical protein
MFLDLSMLTADTVYVKICITAYYCIAGNINIGFIRLPQSQNNCMKIRTYRKPCKSHEGPAWGSVKPSWDC